MVDGPTGVDGQPGSPHEDPGRAGGGWKSRLWSTSAAPRIFLAIGRDWQCYHAFVTSAPRRLDVPSTITLYASTLGDVAGFAADALAIQSDATRSSGRIVLVEETALDWQCARCRDGNHVFVSADRDLVGPTVLQRWVWRRLLNQDAVSVRHHQ